MNSLKNAQHIRDTISQNTPRLSRPIVSRLLQTALIPFLAFVITLLASGYARLYVDRTFRDDSLSLLTAFSTTLLTVIFTWRAWQWSERRFGGWANVSAMFGVVRGVARLEKAIDSAAQLDENINDELDSAAQSAWNTYTTLAQRVGVNVDR